MQPLILTALLDEQSQSLFNRLRRLHFPAERNYLDAHVTLFHKLPGEQQASIISVLGQVEFAAPLSAYATKLVLLGGGVAYRIESSELMTLRNRLFEAWHIWLTKQDEHKRELHVTVQNKVDAATARRLHTQLAFEFKPVEMSITGLALWRYCDGPWEVVRKFEWAN